MSVKFNLLVYKRAATSFLHFQTSKPAGRQTATIHIDFLTDHPRVEGHEDVRHRGESGVLDFFVHSYSFLVSEQEKNNNKAQ